MYSLWDLTTQCTFGLHVLLKSRSFVKCQLMTQLLALAGVEKDTILLSELAQATHRFGTLLTANKCAISIPTKVE
jgi:hypothetical protein